MAGRPHKNTVDYFPHYTTADSSRTLTILQDRFGNNGYTLWFRLLERLGRSEGHYYDCRGEENWAFLVAKFHVDAISATEILNTLAKLDAIDSQLWSKKVIWCQNFVDGLAEVYRKRGKDLPQKPTISATEMPISATEIHRGIADNPSKLDTELQNCNKNNDNARTNSSISATEMPISATENTQRIVKDSKEKNSREKDSKGNAVAVIAKSYEENIGMITAIIKDEIVLAVREYPLEWINDAIKEAVKNQVRKWSYISKILENWKIEGRGNGHKRELNKSGNQGIPGNRPTGAFADIET